MQDWKNSKQSKWASFIPIVITMLFWFSDYWKVTLACFGVLCFVLYMVFTA